MLIGGALAIILVSGVIFVEENSGYGPKAILKYFTKK